MQTHEIIPRVPIKRFAENANTDEPVIKKSEKSLEDESNGVYVDETLLSSSIDFDGLPPEVFQMIFSEFFWKNKLSFRLVCKSWYERFIESEKVSLKIRGKLDCTLLDHLENCSFKHLFLKFEDDDNGIADLNELPPVIWEKIGPNIRELHFSLCRLGDVVMTKILSICNNLQNLIVDLGSGNATDSFCSRATLEALENIASKKLRFFEICRYSKDAKKWENFASASVYDPVIWTPIFAAFVRLFPSLGEFVVTHNGNFTCVFRKEIYNTDESELATVLAYSLSARKGDWISALEALTKISCKEISLTIRKRRFRKKDEVALLNLFDNQKKVEVVTLHLIQQKGRGDEEMLRNIFLKIVRNCPKLYRFNYRSNEYRLPWLNNLRKHASSLSFEKLSMNRIQLCPESLTVESTTEQKNQEKSLMRAIPGYSYVSYLCLTFAVSDEILQCIFQYMTNLKTLEFCWRNSNSDFALTGRRNGVPENSPAGYSIKRLRNLEKLNIKWLDVIKSENATAMGLSSLKKFDRENSELSDDIFYEFKFPKLQTLHCFPPEDVSLLVNFGIYMPSLRKISIYASQKISSKVLTNFCRFTYKLHTVHVEQSELDLEDVKGIFGICPSLRFVHSRCCTDFYEPFSKEVRRHRVQMDKVFLRTKAL